MYDYIAVSIRALTCCYNYSELTLQATQAYKLRPCDTRCQGCDPKKMVANTENSTNIYLSVKHFPVMSIRIDNSSTSKTALSQWSLQDMAVPNATSSGVCHDNVMHVCNHLLLCQCFLWVILDDCSGCLNLTGPTCAQFWVP